MSNLTYEIIGAAIEVHRQLGPGLCEAAYEECFSYELSRKHLSFTRQLAFPIPYKGRLLTKNFRIDLLVENQVVIELKAVHQLLRLLKDGVRRKWRRA